MSFSQKTAALGDRAGVLFCALLGIGVAGVLGLRLRASLPEQPTPETATISPQKTFQTLTGFGASTAYYQDWLADHPQRGAICVALYQELGLDILRLRNTYVQGKTNFAAAELKILRDVTRAHGAAPVVMMSSWSPPGSLKSTGDARNGGTLARHSGSYNYAGYAQWWRESLVAYEKIGITPDFVSIQNEPDWKDTWETCLFRPQETSEYASYGQALSAVAEALKTLPTPPKLIGPETLGANNPQQFLAPTQPQAALVDGVAHHLYNGGKETDPDSFIPALNAIRDAYPRQPKLQTEFGRGDGFQTAWLIHNCLTQEDASAYLYWAAIWPGPDALVTVESPWAPKTWKYPQGFVRTDRFYALEHYAHFLKPGFVRVAIQSPRPDLRLSAFKSPDSARLVVVGLNIGREKGVTLALEAAGYVPKLAFRTVKASHENFASISTEELTVPPQGLLTVVLEKVRP